MARYLLDPISYDVFWSCNMQNGSFKWQLVPATVAAVIALSSQSAKAENIGIAELTSYDQADYLAELLINDGITSISNASYTGALSASGVFTNGTDVVGIEQGIILTTGSASSVIGPNSNTGTSTNNGLEGYAPLTELTGVFNYSSGEDGIPADGDPINVGDPVFVDGELPSALEPNYIENLAVSSIPTYDASVLSFDFIPEGDQLQFSYVFGSEEYLEYVNSGYNDVFGFYVNGENAALLPDGENVAINNINSTKNSEYFIDNTYSVVNTELDGLTTKLNFTAAVNPGVTNTITLAIADASDYIYDSAVFIQSDFESVVSDEATAGSTQLNALMPDEVDPETGGFSFTFDKPEDMIFIDPEVAVGYVYEVTSEHEFASVLLPLIGDGEFLLQIYNEATGEFEGNYVLDYGVEYFFDDYTSEEVTLFQILGIEVEEEIDPTDVTAFVTGLTFNTLPGATNPSLVTMSQTPITQMIGGNTTPSEVPVPATLALFGLGLVIMARRRKAA